MISPKPLFPFERNQLRWKDKEKPPSFTLLRHWNFGQIATRFKDKVATWTQSTADNFNCEWIIAKYIYDLPETNWSLPRQQRSRFGEWIWWILKRPSASPSVSFPWVSTSSSQICIPRWPAFFFFLFPGSSTALRAATDQMQHRGIGKAEPSRRTNWLPLPQTWTGPATWSSGCLHGKRSEAIWWKEQNMVVRKRRRQPSWWRSYGDMRTRRRRRWWRCRERSWDRAQKLGDRDNRKPSHI